MDLPFANATAYGDRIAISQDDFRLLLLHAHRAVPHDPPDPSLMQIAASEYEFLKRNFGEYLNLRKNLLEDGVTPDTLEMYIQPRLGSTYGPSHNFTQYGNNGASSSYVTTDQSSKYSDVSASARASEFSQQPIVGSTFHGFMTSASAADCTPAVAKDLAASHNPEAYPFRMHGQFDLEQYHFSEPANGKIDEDQSPLETAHPPREDQRSLHIVGLSPDTTLNEILEHVKGGMVLDIFRWNDRTACLSFFRGTDAQAYRAYARRHDVYIKNKRVEVDWADRQFYPNTATYNRIINNGATRILRLCNAANQLNEQTVRDDMEHIHNLVILKVKMEGHDLIVHTNSIQGCGFARTCMMSRMPYRLLKLDFVPDKCAEPLPNRTRSQLFDAVRPTSQRQLKPQISANLYDILKSEDSEDDEEYGNLQRSGRRDSALSDSSSEICRPRSTDSDAISCY